MVRDHVAEALDLFKSGYHCSQAVLAVFAEEYGLQDESALKIASPFGGGLAGFGRTCGAITGAMMVVGLKYGNAKSTDREAAALCREKTRVLIEKFEKTHGTSMCNELVGFDRSTMKVAELMEKLPHFYMVCPKFLETVITYLEEEL